MVELQPIREVDMKERRLEPRMLCADLVTVRWKEGTGDLRECTGNLEDISVSGACIQVEIPLEAGVLLIISHPERTFQGQVKNCFFQETGYFLNIEFGENSKWSEQEFCPQHLLDPRTLTPR